MERKGINFDEVVDNRVPPTVTRQGGKGNFVMISEAELNGWQETVHPLSNPANARRLLHSIRFGDAGKTGEHRRVYRILGKRSADQRMEFVPCRYHCGN